MSLNLKMSTTALNAEADALGSLCNGGFLRIYSDLQPVNSNTPVTNQILLAELTFPNPAFSPAVNGVLTSNPLIPDISAKETGIATWSRIVKSDGVTVVMDGTVGLVDCNMIVKSVNIQKGILVSITKFRHVIPT